MMSRHGRADGVSNASLLTEEVILIDISVYLESDICEGTRTIVKVTVSVAHYSSSILVRLYMHSASNVSHSGTTPHAQIIGQTFRGANSE